MRQYFRITVVVAVPSFACGAAFMRLPIEKLNRRHSGDNRHVAKCPPHSCFTHVAPYRPQSSRRKALIDLTADEANSILGIAGIPSLIQRDAFSGRNPRQAFDNLADNLMIVSIGLPMSYFIASAGFGSLGTLLGFVFATWIFYYPYYRSFQKNWELLGGRRIADPRQPEERNNLQTASNDLHSALLVGVIDDLVVVTSESSIEEYDLSEFDDYRMGTDEWERETGRPYLLRLRLTDSENRALQIHAKMNEDYVDLDCGLPVTTLLFSPSREFEQLHSYTELYVPDLKCWIGDYPFLNHQALDKFLMADDIDEAIEDELDSYDEGDLDSDESMHADSTSSLVSMKDDRMEDSTVEEWPSRSFSVSEDDILWEENFGGDFVVEESDDIC